jgi:hypothetical protein
VRQPGVRTEARQRENGIHREVIKAFRY